MDSGFHHIYPVIYLHLGELDDQDSVLRRQTDQGYQTDLEIDIVLQPRHPDTQVSTQRGDRQGKQYGDRHDPALILSRQEQEDKQEYQRQDKSRLPTGLFLLIGKTAPLQTDILGQMLPSDPFHRRHRLARTISRGGYGIDRGRGEHIETLDRSRAGRILGRAQGGQGNHRPVLAAHEEQVQIIPGSPVRRLRLDIYTVNTVEHIEVVHVHGAKISLHGRENIGQGDAEKLRPVTIHVEIQLRDLALHGGRYALKLRRLRGVIQEGIRGAYQIIPASVSPSLQLHLQATALAQARDYRRTVHVRLSLGVIIEFPAGIGHHVLYLHTGGFTLFPRFQDHRQRGTPLVRTDTGTATRYVLHVGHGRMMVEELDRTVCHGTCTLQCSPLGHLQLNGEEPLILLRDKAGRQHPVQDEDSHQHHPEPCQDTAGISDGDTQQLRIFLISFRQPQIDLTENKRFLLMRRTQDDGAHRRAQRQGHYRGQQHGNYDRNGELTVQLPRDTSQETHRHEHGGQYHGGSDQGAR